MKIDALQRMFPGKFHAGVGSGVREWMGQVGTGGPKALALSGQLADGELVCVGTTREGVRLARAHIYEGRARAARTE
jgi:hypothetical protein